MNDFFPHFLNFQEEADYINTAATNEGEFSSGQLLITCNVILGCYKLPVITHLVLNVRLTLGFKYLHKTRS